MMIQSKERNDHRPYICLDFHDTSFEIQCSQMLEKIANLPDNFWL